MSNDFCPDEFWNSKLSWSDENPGFTSCFNQTVLIWTPCVFLWIFTFLDHHRRSSSRSSDIPWSLLNVTKFVIVVALLCLSFIELTMLLSEDEFPIFTVQYVSLGVKIFSFILAGCLQYYHKRKGHRSSGLLFTFWLLLSFCSIPQLRWEVINYQDGDFNPEIILPGFQFINFATYFLLISVMTILNCFCDKLPRNSTYPKNAKPCPDLHASILNRIFFAWLEPVILKGYRRPLVENDIYSINPENSSAELVPVFNKNFKKSQNRAKKSQNVLPQKSAPTQATAETSSGLTSTLFRTFGGFFFYSAIFKFFMEILQFTSPLLLHVLMDYVDEGGALWKGLLLSFTLFGITFLISILNGQVGMTSYQVGFRIRTALISSIYRKALKMSSASKRTTTVGEIVNLMAVDAHRFFEMIPYLHIVWSGPIVISIAIFLLWRYLEYAAFVGLVVMIFIIPLSGFIATQLKSLQAKQMKVKDERVKAMNEILSGMRVLKLYAWEPSFEMQIENIRHEEMIYLRKAALINAITDLIWSLAPFLVALFSFMTFVYLGNELTPQIAFVSMSLFNILRMPMTLFPMVINFVMMAWVSVKRLNKFMISEELDPECVTNEPNENALEIKNGTFSWGGDQPTLKSIDVRVPRGSLVAIVGSVGSGKSSLIAALLGEMEKVEGSINVDGRIAYVPQQAWIQNATLRDNITFGRPYVKKFYDQVVDACALRQDFAMLPGGDYTEIGEKGINLSGGQKQRVSLARAVYSGAEIYIFDDPLSAVDSHVGKHIFDNVISDGGLLKTKTRFLVTHAISYLPRVNEIFVMVDGEITEKGSYRNLMSQKGTFSEFLIQHLQENSDDDEINEIEDDEIKEIIKRSSSLSLRRFKDRSSSRRSSTKSTKSSQEDLKTIEKSVKSKLIESEESQTGSVDWRIYLRYFKSIGGLFVLLILSMNIVNQTFSVLANFWLTQWTTDKRAFNDSWWKNFYIGIYGTFGIAQGLAIVSGSILFAIGALRSARNLHRGLLRNILRLPMSFFDTTPLGRIMNRFSKDTDIIDAILPHMMRNWLWMLTSVVAIFIVISIATPFFAIIVIPILILYYFIQKFFIATSRQLKRLESVTRSPIYSHFSETISGQSVIRAYKEQKRFVAESEDKVDRNQAISYLSICANRWLGVRLEILGAFVVLAASLFAVLSRETIGAAIVGLSITYALQTSSLMNFFVRITTEVETNIVAVERVEEYSDVPQEAAWKTVEVDPKWPQNGVVEFIDFQLRYREGLDLVLKGINFSAKSKEKIGIVGRTGAGKSSLTLALFRIIESAGGKIVIDEIDISQIGLHSLRSRLTIIPQDPVLFSATLRTNIDPFHRFSDDEIWTALEQSHLKSFVKGLPDGLMYKIAEGGENLSIGQRQLVCLSRALLRKTKVLILDEATAAIDIETDELIQRTIRTQFNDCTILTIAHRLNTILDSDRIIVLDKGMIAEFDTPENLLKNGNSIFYSMAKEAGLVDSETATLYDSLGDDDSNATLII